MALDPLTAGIELATLAVNKIWPDKTEQEKAELAASIALVQGQLKINQVEAANPNVFTSGWRPFIGWICGCGLAYQFLIYPILIAWAPKIVQLDMGTLITLLGGMLGLGALRTAEKFKGVNS
jgi:hypothetical protein